MASLGSVTNNVINNASTNKSSHVTGIGGMNGTINTSPSVYTTLGAHHHAFGTLNPATVIDLTYMKSFNVMKDGVEVLVIKENAINLNEIDKLDISELISVFKYIKEDYPNLYADLILKGIIK